MHFGFRLFKVLSYFDFYFELQNHKERDCAVKNRWAENFRDWTEYGEGRKGDGGREK